MDDNVGGWTAIHVPWKDLVESLYQKIGCGAHFRFSSEVQRIRKIEDNPGCIFEVETNTSSGNKVYYANKVVVATTVDAVRKIVPGASSRTSIYQQIRGQPFLIVYAKFDRESTEIMKKYVSTFTVLERGHLQKMIPMDPSKGVYMIAYSDNQHAATLKAKGALENTRKNCELYSKWAMDALGIPASTPLHIIAIKDYYWSIGTHYYAPLGVEFKTRTEFIRRAQTPMKGMVVVGEMVSRDQGWVEGALESVDAVITRDWVSMLY